MLPVTVAKRAILNLLSNLTCSDYVCATQLDTESKKDITESSEPDESVHTAILDKSDDAIYTCHSEYHNLYLEFKLQSESLLLATIENVETDSQNIVEKRRTLKIEYQAKKLEIAFVTKLGFATWLKKFLQHKDIDQKEIDRFFSILRITYISFDLFTDYQRFTQDSLTKLSTRSALQTAIDNNMHHGNMMLCMIHCRDFQSVNRKFGQDKGDLVLHEIADTLIAQTRSDDIVCRFGGALFGIAAHANEVEEGKFLANKIQIFLQSKPFLNNAIKLSFSIGVAECNISSIDHDETPSKVLITRAEQALKLAQSKNEPAIIIWEEGNFSHEEQEIEYLGGIFTPDNITNYRNMLLLWDISSIIADEHTFTKLLFNVIERLSYTFEFNYAGIVSGNVESEHNILVSTSDFDNIRELPLKDALFLDTLLGISRSALSNKQPEHKLLDKEEYLIIPFGIEQDECFFMIGDEDNLALTTDSKKLLAGFARQIGKALKRTQLEEALNKHLTKQNAMLTEELAALKSDLKSNAFIYKSRVMQDLMVKTQRAAHTDTTILITGESGTGKEKLINAVHRLSNRTHKPAVIVDCGSIPETLIESELFGHIKGAFTGAQSDKKGKIQAADKGILVLDEIGELPLSMQPKLLRFVQEKHYSPVGSTELIQVDVKIVAVTNRDLLKEVEIGKFRNDLYYRLNVVRLNNPPLRERIDDLELLSQHFLAKYSTQFGLDKKYLSSTTIERMKQYHWPGNIRQLENKLMQACLLSEKDEISYHSLNISSEELQAFNGKSSLNTANHQNLEHQSVTASTVNSVVESVKDNMDLKSVEQLGELRPEEWKSSIAIAMDSFISDIDSSITHHNLNIGETIEAYIFKQLNINTRSNKQIADILRIPISTARRKVNKHSQARVPSTLPDSWNEITRLLDMLAQANVVVSEPLAVLKQILINSVLARVTSNMTRAASLIGISEPTLYKFKKNINHQN